MKKLSWKTYAAWIIPAEALGAFMGWLTRDGMKVYEQTMVKPPLTPPGIVFPIAWAVLYALMGVGAARIWGISPCRERTRALILYGVQLVVNLAWTALFFQWRALDAAFFWLLLLLVLILLMMLAFRHLDHTAAWLQAPYLLWVAFAAYLCAGVWMLN